MGAACPILFGEDYREPSPAERVGDGELVRGFDRACLADKRALRQSRCGARAVGRTASGDTRTVTYRCKDRLCSACARIYQSRVYMTLRARLGAEVATWRMVTLTKPDSRTLAQTAESIAELRLAWRRVRALRAKAGLPPLDAVVVTEVTTGGAGGKPHPHAHLHVIAPLEETERTAQIWRETISRISGRKLEDLSQAAHVPRRARYRDGEEAAGYLAGYCAVPFEVNHALDIEQQRAVASQMSGVRRYDGTGRMRGLDLRAVGETEPIVEISAGSGIWIPAARWYSGTADGSTYKKREEACPETSLMESAFRGTSEPGLLPRVLRMRRLSHH